MRRLTIFLTLVLCCTVCVKNSARASDAIAGLKQFSDFSTIDIKRLLAGEILSQRGPLMKFPNGISAQFLFAVPKSPAETAKRLQTWEPERCPSLDVYATNTLNEPIQLKEFNGISRYLEPKNRPVRWFWNQTLATTAHSSDLNLTQNEALTLSRCIGKDATAKIIGDCWGNLLFARVSDFQRNGFTRMPPYEFDVESVNPASHLRSMLLENVLIAREFAPLLQRAGVVDGKAAVPPIKPSYYWRLFQADHRATISLGATYLLQVGAHYQMLDIEYYVSGTYYVSAAIYEIFPVRDGGRSGSLVWCNVLCSAPTLRYASGIERLASGVIMALEFKKCIHCFQGCF